LPGEVHQGHLPTTGDGIFGAAVAEDPAVGAPGIPGRAPGADPLAVRAAGVFAGELAADRISSVRAIRARLHVGQSRARR